MLFFLMIFISKRNKSNVKNIDAKKLWGSRVRFYEIKMSKFDKNRHSSSFLNDVMNIRDVIERRYSFTFHVFRQKHHRTALLTPCINKRKFEYS